MSEGNVGTEAAPAAPAESSGGFESAGEALGIDFNTGTAITPAEPAAAESGGEASSGEPALPSWLEGLAVDDVAYVQNKGLHLEGKGPGDLVNMYRNLEQRLGGNVPEEGIALPDWENAEQVAKYKAAVGVPEAPDAYPELAIDTQRGPLEMSQVNEIAHEIGLHPWQRAKLAELTGKLVDATSAEQDAALAAEMANEAREVVAEFNGSPEKLDAAVKRGMAALEIDAPQAQAMVSALGLKKTIAIMNAQAAVMISKEQVSEGGDKGGFVGTMSKDVAKARMKQRMGDKAWREELFAGKAERVEEWQNLQAAASAID